MGRQQTGRFCQLDVQGLAQNAFLVENVSATEALSRLFQLDLDVVSTSGQITFKDVVGKPAFLTLRLNDGGTRQFNGFISRLALGGAAVGGLFQYRVQVVPWLWFLTRRVDCRIFEKMNPLDVIGQIVNEHEFAVFFKPNLKTTPKVRDYCVQYRETDFNFVSRLMEEEGITYFFDHPASGAPDLVLVNDKDDFPERAAANPFRLLTAQDGTAAQPVGDIETWLAEQELQSGNFVTADFNVKDKRVVSGERPASERFELLSGDHAALEIFDFPSEQFDDDANKARAELRIQAEEAGGVRHSGTAVTPLLVPGLRFTLRGHVRSELNIRYLVTSVHHSISQQVRGNSGGVYFNSFSCIPASLPFRPPLVTPKPVIQGVQTAIVVGKDDPAKTDPPPSDDIDIDDEGRVLVKFHWDRSGPSAKFEGKKFHRTSCRVRVSQIIAGKNWGAVFWPRIGHEVIVEFVEGDPDRPIITGRVYNGKSPMPYTLTANKTQSGIKTRSTPDGTPTNFNEIRFEDKKGSEELFLQAEKTMTVKVKASQSTSVGGSQSTTIGQNQSVTIHKGNRTVTLEKGNDALKLDVGNRSAELVVGNDTLTVTAGNIESKAPAGTHKMQALNIELTATASLKITCGGSSIEMTPAMITIKSPMVKIN